MERPTSRPKGDKRQRTRALLLEAARELVREKGYDRTTLKEVAERVGMTIGAIYGNFENREALFVALGETWWPPIQPDSPPDASFAEHMRALATATLAALPARESVVVGRLAGLSYTFRSEAMRHHVRETTALHYEIGAAWLASLRDAPDLPMPPEILVRVLHALIEGLTLQRLLSPELIGDEVFYAAFEALATSRPRDTTARGD